VPNREIIAELLDEPRHDAKRCMPDTAGNRPPTARRPRSRSGGARRDRTDDLLLAKQALSQLSYGPVRYQKSGISSQGYFLTPDT
jgi:hypothetical protein